MKNLSPWAIVGIAAGGVAVVATGVVVAVKYLNKKKKAEEGLKNNEYAVKHTIGMNIDDIINGNTR